MSAGSCTYSCHHLGILMSGAGRFVSCIHCHLTLSFPAGADYDTVVKQFEYHSCSIPILSNQDAARGEHLLRLTNERRHVSIEESAALRHAIFQTCRGCSLRRMSERSRGLCCSSGRFVFAVPKHQKVCTFEQTEPCALAHPSEDPVFFDKLPQTHEIVQ
jgi:hypothetical protein